MIKTHTLVDFNKFESVIEKYLPDCGEGITKATQAITALNNLVYRWFNDGDVFDNTYGLCAGFNNLSTYANWLYNNIPELRPILDRIKEYDLTENGYTELLMDACETVMRNETMLTALDYQPAVGSIYEEKGPFEFIEFDDEEEDMYWDF